MGTTETRNDSLAGAPEKVRIAVIGGSGLYNIPELMDIVEYAVPTPFGPTSDNIVVGTLFGERVAFLPRHRRGHTLTPSEVPYRANIYALKTMGVTHIISVSACGSLKEDIAPGNVVIPDQIYDNTRLARGRSFFEGGLVAHVSVADPFCTELNAVLAEAITEAGGTVHTEGTFVTIEGPRFSTKAESNAYRQLGFSIIGMTTSPEAFLAREAEIAYSVMAHITDYDVWHSSEEPVTVETVLRQFHDNIALAQQGVLRAIEKLVNGAAQRCSCHDALGVAFATNRERVAPEVIERLQPIVGRYFATSAAAPSAG